eukprot:1077222-Amorphochlora_amoeboformis.AAC.2
MLARVPTLPVAVAPPPTLLPRIQARSGRIECLRHRSPLCAAENGDNSRKSGKRLGGKIPWLSANRRRLTPTILNFSLSAVLHARAPEADIRYCLICLLCSIQSGVGLSRTFRSETRQIPLEGWLDSLVEPVDTHRCFHSHSHVFGYGWR